VAWRSDHTVVATYISAAGGGIVFLGAIIGLLRGVFKQTAATENNTAALTDLRTTIRELSEKYSNHEARLNSLEDWRKYGEMRAKSQ
jgi:hypothetical protein